MPEDVLLPVLAHALRLQRHPLLQAAGFARTPAWPAGAPLRTLGVEAIAARPLDARAPARCTASALADELAEPPLQVEIGALALHVRRRGGVATDGFIGRFLNQLAVDLRECLGLPLHSIGAHLLFDLLARGRVDDKGLAVACRTC